MQHKAQSRRTHTCTCDTTSVPFADTYTDIHTYTDTDATELRIMSDPFDHDQDFCEEDAQDFDRPRRSSQSFSNHARQRPKHIPRPDSASYPDFKASQLAALRAAVHHLWEELGTRSGVSHLTFSKHSLILLPRSQSKLSQQELSDLQKATHFDKKELQQWYKGMNAQPPAETCIQGV